jgi:pSer/pThr/pTyr-binding forkhead associated (FHA) protein
MEITMGTNREIIIEEISRGQKLIRRHKLNKNTISIGRGYQSDIILSDPHVCPEHLQLMHNGEHWVIQDSGSINGSFLADGKTELGEHIVNSGDVISFGKSQIRLVFPNHPVAETVNFSTFESFINLMRNPIVLTVSILLFAFVSGYLFYLNKTIESNFLQLLVPAVSMTLLFAAWPWGVSLISHLTKHDARIMAQLGISFAFFNLLWLSDVLDSIVAFNFSSNWPMSGLMTLVPIALAFSLFWLNSYIGFHMSERRRIIVASSLILLFFGGTFLVQLSNKPEFSAKPSYDATIMIPSFMFAPSSDVTTFIENSKSLFKETQELAEKE